MSDNTIDGLRARIDLARKRERDARTAAARLAREMGAMSRRQETQKLCVLGRSWSAYADAHPDLVDSMHTFLENYITRDTDRVALVTDSRWALSESVAVPQREWE
jgi:hypothetical protein